ncbi:hypothetical protein [Rhizobium leguminosarum]|uniref:hypothetical protein n=1 Tax=Rhizobium leguminosarum TaxID=384 RepID=UPI0015FA2977|nr:hypothetical protein [Rhizobium leguminosarum]MBA9036778.1 hypothetical protein [Rhizobium leguminosarum]
MTSVKVRAARRLRLIGTVFLFAFRGKATNKPTTKSADNHDVFDKDPSFFSSYDAADK